ncbi:NAD(P)H-dependent oxidoreductase subunit E [Candidatus Sumerlaeota bacterium]|nr:NAD(P)H-dependent oxidoreductase subunit E [Candidatus Sumerlaeota bacterium]
MSEQLSSAPDISRTVKKWLKKRGSLIMALHEIQNTFGYVPRSVSLQLAHLMDVPLARIYEVLTFYNYFRLDPPGKNTISVCMGTACYLKGAPKLVEAFAEELGVQEGETTPDGQFFLQSVRCVGCCGLAPVVVVNGTVMSKVDVSQVKEIIASCMQKEEV